MSENICDICNKKYKTNKSLWNHRKNIHNITKKTIQENETEIENSCGLCSRQFTRQDNLKRHLEICKFRRNIDNKIINENIKLKNELSEIKKVMKKLINTKCKMDYREFNKLRKLLDEEANEHAENPVVNNMINNGVVNNGPINNGPVNNGTINNINIIAFGDEKLAEIFTDNEKKTVLNEKNNALTYLIEYVHFNERYPQFNNIIVTNNRANEAYIFDKDMRKFKLVKKNNLIEDLLDYRTCDIEDFFYELQDHLDPETRKIILKLAEHRGDDESTREQVKLLLFNNKDKVKHLLK
jgi:hypothetical protein